MVPLAQRYYETLRLLAVHFAALRFLRLAIPSFVPCSSLQARDRLWINLELVSRCSSRPSRWRRQGLPSSRGTLVIIRHVLRPRRDQAGLSGPRVSCLARPPRASKTRAHNDEISGLNHKAFDLAVYASQWRSPATTQDWLPAAGPALPDGIGYPQSSDRRFHI